MKQKNQKKNLSLPKEILVSGLIGLLGFTGCTPHAEKSPVQAKNSLLQAEENLRQTPSFENHISVALEYDKVGRRDEALALYVKARDMSPQAPLAWNNVCAELNSMGRHLEALSQCEKAVELDPTFGLARANLEFTRKKLQEGQGELYAKKESLLRNPHTSSAELLSAGFEFYNQKDYPPAIELWSKIKPEAPEYPNAQNNLATIYILTGAYPKAETHLGKALAREPRNELFLNNQVWLRQKREASRQPSQSK